MTPVYQGNRNATYIQIRAGLGPWVLEHTVAHEFAHAIHRAYATAASQQSYGWFRDAFANWAALQVEPGNLSIAEQASCVFRSPELVLDDRVTGKCDPVGSPAIARDYGAFLPLESISRRNGQGTVRQILEATERVTTAFEAMDITVPGTLKDAWPPYAKALWNQDPYREAGKASFFNWNGYEDAPLLAPDQRRPVNADLNGQMEDETLLDARVNNMSVKFYQFTFSDAGTRSLMFHNTWRDNKQRGQRVSVQALYKPEGQSWKEEDWSDYEWIGFCRDAKEQRLEALVIIVASAEWSGANPVVQAAKQPSLMRNAIGCWGYSGLARRTTRLEGGRSLAEFNAMFDYKPSGRPLQYTDQATGRMRVPVAAPLLRGGELRFDEDYTQSGCHHTASTTVSETSNVLGGMAAGTIVINNFLDSLPDDLRAQQQQLTGTASGAYVADGVSLRLVNGTVTGPQECGTSYDTGVGAWLLTASPPATLSKVAADGHLRATFITGSSGEHTFEWDLAPMREP
jgi:hypothetical protein